MSGTTTAGTQYAVSGDPAEIHTVSQNLANSVLTTVVPKFADTASRDAAYSGVTATNLAGTVCWVRNRQGHCFYDSAAWRWVPQKNIVVNQSRPSAAGTGDATPVAIILTSGLTLPAGNRHLLVKSYCTVTQQSAGSTEPRAYISGTGLTAPDGFMQQWLTPGVNAAQITLQGEWDVITSGTVGYSMFGLNAGSAGSISFTGSILKVWDLGPCDD